MYQKLNYLASSVTPQYTDKGYMTGNISKLTVGNYVKEQYGKIDSVSFEIPEESPWMVGENTDFMNTRMGEMPFIIKVQMRYTVIHNFRPELVTNILGKTDKEDTIPRFGDQRYITYKVDKNSEDYQISLNQELDEVTANAKSIQGDVLIPSLYTTKTSPEPPYSYGYDTLTGAGINQLPTVPNTTNPIIISSIPLSSPPIPTTPSFTPSLDKKKKNTPKPKNPLKEFFKNSGNISVY